MKRVVLLKPIMSVGHELTYHKSMKSTSSDVYECVIGLGKDHCAFLYVDGEFVRENPEYFAELSPNLPLNANFK